MSTKSYREVTGRRTYEVDSRFLISISIFRTGHGCYQMRFEVIVEKKPRSERRRSMSNCRLLNEARYSSS